MEIQLVDEDNALHCLISDYDTMDDGDPELAATIFLRQEQSSARNTFKKIIEDAMVTKPKNMLCGNKAQKFPSVGHSVSYVVKL